MTDLFGLGRTERVMVHAGSKDSQSSLATQRVIAGQNDLASLPMSVLMISIARHFQS